VIRHSSSTKSSTRVKDWTGRFAKKSNLDFFAAAFEQFEGGGKMAIGLLGQRDLPGVALRRAQAILRWDLRPSLWSHAFLVTGTPRADRSIAGLKLREVTIHSRAGEFPDPAHNAVTDARLGDYDDPLVDANAALLVVQMSPEQLKDVAYRTTEEGVNLDRLRYDLWQTLGVWQTYFWSAGAAGNPLREGFPVFSSAFVEYCYEAIALDLAPGASERSSAPEHLWNAALWWHEEFKKLGHPISGRCVVRDPYAALLDPDELERGAK
jgi:hypothetical protein